MQRDGNNVQETAAGAERQKREKIDEMGGGYHIIMV
jgi:hypothetical protein